MSNTTDRGFSLSPRVDTYELLLTAQSAVSHHDAAQQTDSNRNLFNRQRLLLPIAGADNEHLMSAEAVKAIAEAYKVPADLAPVCETLSFPEFVATAIVKNFISEYGRRGSGAGTGLFEGMERYSRLEARVKTSATHARSLRGWWDRLCHQMGVGMHAIRSDEPLLPLLGVPMSVASMVLRACVGSSRTIVMVARTWATLEKLASEKYAEKAGEAVIDGAVTALQFESAGGLDEQAQIVDVPCVSANAVRHQVLRRPAWYHLARKLGLFAADRPGEGMLPAAVEAIFVNGGNIKAGVKQETGAFALSGDIRKMYPALDLLGGVTNSFDIGPSMVRVNAWVVCRENARALGKLADELPTASISVFDMVDDVTHTRQAHRGLGQMIWSFETLCQGAQVLVRLSLDPFIRPLTHGALVCALREFAGRLPVIGGQSARGYGQMTLDFVSSPSEDLEMLAKAYEDFLSNRREELIDGMMTGKMGTPKVVLS